MFKPHIPIFRIKASLYTTFSIQCNVSKNKLGWRPVVFLRGRTYVVFTTKPQTGQCSGRSLRVCSMTSARGGPHLCFIFLGTSVISLPKEHWASSHRIQVDLSRTRTHAWTHRNQGQARPAAVVTAVRGRAVEGNTSKHVPRCGASPRPGAGRELGSG